MTPLTTVTLFLSWKCNLHCAHCGFSCGPERSEKLPRETARRAIAEAASIPGVRMIAFSGGEPFLFHREMLQHMEQAHAAGLSAGVVTNCYWASSRAAAERRLEEMARLGLQEVIVSFDDYHARLVGAERVQHVVQAALGRGIVVGVNMLVTERSTIRALNARKLLGVDGDPASLWIRESSPVAVGRARRPPRGRITYDGGALRDNPCCFVIRNLVLTPDAGVYACCGFGDASEQGPASIAYLGRFEELGLAELHRRAAHNAVLNLIEAAGPYRLLDLVRAAEPSIRTRDRFVSNCEVCAEISRNARLRSTLARVLAQMAAAAGQEEPADEGVACGV